MTTTLFACLLVLYSVLSTGTASEGSAKRFLGHVVDHVVHGIKCTFSHCGSEHHNPPSITCPKVATHTAPAGASTAKVSWAQPPGASRISGPGPGSNFHEGTTLITYKKTNQYHLSSSCTVSVTVRVIRCQVLGRPTNGRVTCRSTKGRMLLGSKCSFGCNIGYYMVGASTSTCRNSGRMSSGVPACRPVPCGSPRQISNGRFSCNGNTFKKVCHVVCDQGYTVDHSAKYVTCQANRQWTTTKGCLDLIPPIIHHCPTSKIYFADRGQLSTTVKWEKVVAIDPPTPLTPTVFQTRGPRPGSVIVESGLPYVVEYMAVDAAGNRVVAPCTFNVTVQAVRCKRPRLDNGNLLGYSCPSGHIHGAECNLSCNHGALAGPRRITCERDGSFPPTAQWTWNKSLGIKPYCQVQSCLPLRAPRGGALACDKWQNGGLCQMQCHHGYSFPYGAPRGGLYKCGLTTHRWFPSSRVPDCLAMRSFASLQMDASFFYHGPCHPSQLHVIRQNFIVVLKASMFKLEMCKNVLACRSQNVKVTCGSPIKKRDVNRGLKVMVTFEFPYSALNADESETNKKSFQLKFMKGIKSLQGLLNLENNSLTLDTNSTQFEKVIPRCEQGQKEINSSCVGCGPGYVYSDASGSCVACPVGYYQDRESAHWCQSCPLTLTTASHAAASYQDCRAECPPGQFSEDGLSPCIACDTGFFQPNRRQKQCLRCPMGTLSSVYGATSISQCEEYGIIIPPHGDVVFKKQSRDLVTWTYSLWFKMAEGSRGDVMLGLWKTESGHKPVYLYLAGNTMVVAVNETYINSSQVSSKPTWNHCVVTGDGVTGALRVYFNNRNVFTLATSVAVIPRGSELHIASDTSAVTIARLTLHDYVESTAILTDPVKSCQVDETLRDLGLDSIDHEKSSRVDLTFPALCV